MKGVGIVTPYGPTSNPASSWNSPASPRASATIPSGSPRCGVGMPFPYSASWPRTRPCIRLATGIVPVFSRAPSVIAQTIATLDEISGGRMILGLGTSGPAVIENWHGVKFKKPLQRTREYVEIIRMILSGGRVDYDGEYSSSKDSAFSLGLHVRISPSSSPP